MAVSTGNKILTDFSFLLSSCVAPTELYDRRLHLISTDRSSQRDWGVLNSFAVKWTVLGGQGVLGFGFKLFKLFKVQRFGVLGLDCSRSSRSSKSKIAGATI